MPPLDLPSAPSVILSATQALQPPLTYRSTGPPLLLLLPPSLSSSPISSPRIDPLPLQKWAEEGFTVLACTSTSTSSSDLKDTLVQGWATLSAREEVSVLMQDPPGFAIIAYDTSLLPSLVSLLAGKGASDLNVLGLVAFGDLTSLETEGDELPISWIAHVPEGQVVKGKSRSPDSQGKTYVYPGVERERFVLPEGQEKGVYRAEAANLSHSRTLECVRRWLGGPEFDREAIWEEHCLYEFGERSVEKTMATMVAEPYVNHVPTLTGGIGREQLTAFYRDHFIHANPDDTNLVVLSRTVGVNTVIDEFIFEMTHDRMVNWLAPGIPPTHRKIRLPMMSVVTLRGDRLASERIWWDAATLFSQMGLLPTHVPFTSADTTNGVAQEVRLPVSGAEQASKLVDASDGASNLMMGDGWGLRDAPARSPRPTEADRTH